MLRAAGVQQTQEDRRSQWICFVLTVNVPTTVTDTLSLPITKSAGKLKVTCLERLGCEEDTSNKREVEKNCSSPSACTNPTQMPVRELQTSNFTFYFVLRFQNIFTPVANQTERWDFLQQYWPFTTPFNTSLNRIIHFFTTVSGNSKGTLTIIVLRTESDAVGVMAFTEMGISPRTSGLMGMWTDAPPWLSTNTRLTMGTVRPSWSGKTKWNASLSATITVTWQQRQWKSTHITWDAGFSTQRWQRGTQKLVVVTKYQIKRGREDF